MRLALAAAFSLILACLFTALAEAAPMTELFVSTQGLDTNPGTQAKPFATLERAQVAARLAQAKGPVTVWLRGGIFRRDKSFALTAEDSGTTYRAFGSERVSLMGGVALSAETFQPVTDPAVLERLDPAAKPHILVSDLTKQGVTDFGGAWPNTFRGYNGWHELFFEGRRMQIARWPNEGFARMGKVLDKGSVPRVGEKPDRPGRFQYQGDRPERWLKAPEVYLDGYWCFKWYNEVIKVAQIDPADKSITFTVPHIYGVGGYSGGEYFALNLLEELDSPGEYYLDRARGLLYFWPPADLKGKAIGLSVMQDPLVTMTDVSNVTLRGLIFEVSRGAALTMSGGENNLLAACTIRNLANDAVRIAGGKHNGVTACEFSHLGGGGISLSGGDRATLTPCGNFATNNHIHHFGELYRTHHDAINLNGCGCQATHNLIHDAPHHAMDFGGNDHLVEFNEVYRVCLETDDAGAIYTGRNWTVQGNIIRHNFWHDIGGGPAVGNQAIYLDDCAAGTTCTGNVICRVGRAFLLGGGRDNMIKNNVIVDCRIPIHIDNRGVGIAKRKDENWGTLTREFATLPITGELWARRYPHLPTYLTDQPGYPKYNEVTGNLIVACGKMNLAKEAQELSTIRDNLETNEDPGFVNAALLDFTLKPDAAVFKALPDFKPIPFAQIGPKLDEYRKTMPLLIPTISPTPQAFVGEMQVTIGTRFSGATIRYTLDGSDPTEKSPLYSKPLKLTKTTIVKARGFSPHDRTDVAESAFTAMLLGPGHGVYLSDLEPTEAVAHGGLKRDTNYSGKPITMAGKTYAKGITTHALADPQGDGARVTYDLSGGLAAARRFKALVGIDDSGDQRSSCAFIVEVLRRGQWEKVFESPVIKGDQAPVAIDVDITGAEKLRLRVTNGGDNNYSDHATWAEAMVQ
jgi:hypothetical protein